MFITKFNPEECHMSVETLHHSRFEKNGPIPIDQITIKLHMNDGPYLGQIVVLRIPSHMRAGSTKWYGAHYHMTDVMCTNNHEMTLIADEMGIEVGCTAQDCRSGFLNNDLYQIVSLFVVPEYRKMGIGTWILSNLQMMLSRITCDLEPVCVYVPTIIRGVGKTIYEVEQWVKDLYAKTGWKPVRNGARTLFFNLD